MNKRQPRDGHGRFRRNPWAAEMLVKPMMAAAAGHVGGGMAKAATDREVRSAKRKRRKK